VTLRRRRGLRALALPALAGLVLLGSTFAFAGSGPVVREYWVAAVPVTWNVVPNGRNAIEGETFPRAETTLRTVVYKRYTKNWGRPLRDDPNVSGDNDGIPGPLLRARVGETILVHFKNLDNEFDRPHSMHFHGVEYRFGSDGAYIPGFSGKGANVKPGETFTYRLVAGRDSAGVWPYHDHSPSMSDSIDGGMYGALSILGRDATPPDREFIVYFGSMLDFKTINGRAFVGNTPVYHAKVGDRVQWDVLAIGEDHHTFHVHGHRWLTPGRVAADTRTIGPAESFPVRWKEDAPGTWLYHCHVEDHMMNGMIALYRVDPR
jgi:manganese oxidase